VIRLQEVQPKADVVLIEGQANLIAVPAQAHIGEPVVWTLSVQHSSGDGLPEKIKAPFQKKDGWVLTQDLSIKRIDQPDGSVRSEASWTYLSMRPGTRFPGDYTLTLKRGAPLSVELGALEVLGELQESEDAPRPMAPILPIEAGPSGHGGLWLGVGLLATLVFLLLWRRKGARPSEQTVVEPVIWEKLKAVSVPTDAKEARQALFDWHRDIRQGIDRALSDDRSALVDAEWIEQCSEAPGGASLPWQHLESVLVELEGLKYAEPLPGRLTLAGVGERVSALSYELLGVNPSAVREPATELASGTAQAPAVEEESS
jgi:hypothetical protein